MTTQTAKKLMASIKEKYIIGRQPVEYQDFVVVMKILEDLIVVVNAKKEQDKVIETL